MASSTTARRSGGSPSKSSWSGSSTGRPPVGRVLRRPSARGCRPQARRHSPCRPPWPPFGVVRAPPSCSPPRAALAARLVALVVLALFAGPRRPPRRRSRAAARACTAGCGGRRCPACVPSRAAAARPRQDLVAADDGRGDDGGGGGVGVGEHRRRRVDGSAALGIGGTCSAQPGGPVQQVGQIMAEVAVEHPDDQAHLRIDAPRAQGDVDVELVVAGGDRQRAGALDARLDQRRVVRDAAPRPLPRSARRAPTSSAICGPWLPPRSDGSTTVTCCR